ncbi:MAG: MBL fold metallo-hydrolase [Nocardioidaceae bacterium]|nr:MAG: MBL fold metallo-hydrolase [Nocardioidaceae bacterium]
MTTRLAWLGHSTVVLDVDGARVLTDPLLQAHNGILRRMTPPPRRDQWADPDAVLISHLHHDHAELSSLRMVNGAPTVTAPANADFLRGKGIRGATGLVADDWLEVAPGVEVRLVRAIHGHRPMPHRPNAANGHLLRTSAMVVWFAGDTSLYDEIAVLADLAEQPVDLAVVPIGGWGARLSGGHMGPREAAEACRLVGAKQALAVHYGTLTVPAMSRFPRGWMQRPGGFDLALADLAPGCERIRLAPSESVTL